MTEGEDTVRGFLHPLSCLYSDCSVSATQAWIWTGLYLVEEASKCKDIFNSFQEQGQLRKSHDTSELE